MASRGIPSFLASGYFVQVHPEVVRKLKSANQAMCLQKLSYWLERSENKHDGHYWVYNTYEDWSNDLGLTPGQVEHAMTAMVEMGLIITAQPEAFNRRKWYRIDVDHEFWDFPKAEISEMEGGNLRDGSRKSPCSTSYTKNTSKNTQRDTAYLIQQSSSFDEFWSFYPRKTAKATAKKAWMKLGSGDWACAVLGAKNFAADPNREDTFTPHPATWLNGERWNDEPLPPRKRSVEEIKAQELILSRQKAEAERLRQQQAILEEERQRLAAVPMPEHLKSLLKRV